jgi:D-sedoheptulose 7-phosphate isomerase
MQNSKELNRIVELIVDCLKNGNKVLTFGVGGNTANAIHFAAELAGKFEEYETPLPCIDLCSNPSVISAIATDFGWEHVFERQIKALAKPGDVVVAFSISTKGEYLLHALRQACLTKCRLVLICGKSTLDYIEAEKYESPLVWELGSDNTPWVQEEQLKIIHQICREVKRRLNK